MKLLWLNQFYLYAGAKDSPLNEIAWKPIFPNEESRIYFPCSSNSALPCLPFGRKRIHINKDNNNNNYNNNNNNNNNSIDSNKNNEKDSNMYMYVLLNEYRDL